MYDVSLRNSFKASVSCINNFKTACKDQTISCEIRRTFHNTCSNRLSPGYYRLLYQKPRTHAHFIDVSEMNLGTRLLYRVLAPAGV